MKCVAILCLLFVLHSALFANSAGIKEEFTWTRISYVWPTESRFGYGYHKPPSQKQAADSFVFPGQVPNVADNSNKAPPNVNYIFENNVPMGANIWKNKLFVTIPRRRNGVPSSLNYVDMTNSQRHNVPLIPYPDWDVNRLDYEGENRMVSIYRIAIDPCDRAWMVDTGVIEIPGNNTRIQPSALFIIDLNTDKIIKKYEFPANTLRPNTNLANLVIDVTADRCDNAYAYMPDLAGYGLVVYSLKENLAWRVSHNYFFVEPLRGEFFIGGVRFQWNDGIFSAGLSEIQNDGFRTLYFHSMAGTNMYSVSTKILRQRDLATRSYHGNDFTYLGDRGAGEQTSASALHQPSGIYFLGLVNQNALGCWNTKKPFKKENFEIIQKDDIKMIYPCDIKIAGDRVVLLTNNMPVFLYSKLNYDETNFRIWIGNVNEVVKGTNCA